MPLPPPRKESHIKCLTIAALVTAAPLALAAGSTADTSFYRTLAEGSQSEVDLGKLAEQKSTDPKVKDFAAMMVSDHAAADQKLASLAGSKNVMLPKTLGESQQAMRNRLENLEGKQFDKSYAQSQLKAHEDTVKLLENEISSGQDPDAKAFAQSVLPTIQHHLDAARTLASEQGVKAAMR